MKVRHRSNSERMFADLTGRKAVLIERNVTYHLLPAGSVLFTQTLLPNPGHSESSPLFVVVIIVLGPLPRDRPDHRHRAG